VAERKGFEPSRSFHLYALSRGAPSTTRPPLRAAPLSREPKAIKRFLRKFPAAVQSTTCRLAPGCCPTHMTVAPCHRKRASHVVRQFWRDRSSAAPRKLTVSYRRVLNRVICATAFVDSIQMAFRAARSMLNRRTGWVMSFRRKGRVIATFSFRGWGRERCPSAKKNPDPSFKLLTGGQK
jgi:ribosomal protein L20